MRHREETTDKRREKESSRGRGVMILDDRWPADLAGSGALRTFLRLISSNDLCFICVASVLICVHRWSMALRRNAMKNDWLLYVGLAGLAWGTYVPLIFYGGNELGKPPGSRLMAILCVGVAYFVIAVLLPLGMFL